MKRGLWRTAALVFGLGASASGLAACRHVATYVTQDGRALHACAASYRGRHQALRQSHFYGELYDDNERMLLSPYDFATLYHRVDLKGRPITPGPAHGIVPAGTAVRVEGVELPGPLAALARMPNAPKDHIWVRVALDGAIPGLRAGHGRPFFVVLDGPIETAEALQAAMAATLGAPREVADWLGALRPPVRAAIAHKQAMRGMDKAQLTAALGEPWRWLNDIADGAAAEVAWWPGQEAWLVAGRVVQVRPPRAVR